MFAVNYWAYPQALWLLLVIPLFLWGYRKIFDSKRLIVNSSFPSDHIPNLTPIRWVLVYLPYVFYLLALVACILALARPQVQSKWENQDLKGQEFICLIDMSQSMVEVEGRISSIQTYLISLLESFDGDRMGIILFGEEAFTYVPITWDSKALQELIARIKPGMIPAGGTSIGNAIALGLRRLESSQSNSPSLLLFSDGGNNRSLIAPMSASRMAAEKEVPLTAIIWRPNPDSLRLRQNMARDSLTWTQMTELGGGRTYFLPFASDIPRDISIHLASDGDSLNRKELNFRRVKELYPNLLFGAFILLSLSFLFRYSSWSNPLEM